MAILEAEVEGLAGTVAAANIRDLSQQTGRRLTRLERVTPRLEVDADRQERFRREHIALTTAAVGRLATIGGELVKLAGAVGG